jgi:hypothetical protein
MALTNCIKLLLLIQLEEIFLYVCLVVHVLSVFLVSLYCRHIAHSQFKTVSDVQLSLAFLGVLLSARISQQGHIENYRSQGLSILKL